MSNRIEASRLPPDARREQILKVAALHFARSEREPVSIQAIATDAGVTRALVYHYFPGKDALLEAVLRQEAAGLLAATAPDSSLSPHDNLERALEAYLDHFAASTGALRDLYSPRAVAGSPAHDLAHANHEVQIGRIIDALGLGETKETRIAIGGWFGFVFEVARGWADNPEVSRTSIIRLCHAALEAVTGQSIGERVDNGPPRTGPAK